MWRRQSLNVFIWLLTIVAWGSLANISALAQFGGAGNIQGGGGNQGGNQGGGVGGNQGGQGGQGAGVVIDADGVLRTKFFRDPGWQLTRKRIAEAKTSLNPDIVRPSKLRKVSLNRLEAVATGFLAQGGDIPDDMKYLAGMTHLRYVFFYPETNDIVIAGPAEGYMKDLSGRTIGISTGRSTMELQDMVVALRAFPPTGSRTNVISVSIDPTQEGLQKMQRFLVRIGGRAFPRDTRRIVTGLRESLGLQKVSIGGVSPKTHFAQVMVEADYRMKLIGIGLEKPPVKITSYVEKASPAAVSRNALQRWYFTPNYESVRVSKDDLAMELVGEGVKLIGANELVTAQGQRVGAKTIDRASQVFVRSFTQKYPELARKSPVYAQLRNLINMSIAAAFIQQQDYYGQASWDMNVFGNENAYQLETYEVPKQVETAVNAIWKGRTLMTPIGGGVHIQPLQALESDSMLDDKDGQLASQRGKADIRDLPKNRWWWD